MRAFQEDVDETDPQGKVITKKKMSQKAFIKKWALLLGLTENQCCCVLRRWRAGPSLDDLQHGKRASKSRGSGRMTPYREIEKVVFDWLVTQQANGLRVTTYEIQVKCREVMEATPGPGFTV